MYIKNNLNSFLEMVDSSSVDFDEIDDDCIEEGFINELEKESCHIKEFFYCNDCKSTIKDIYGKIRNNEIPYNKVETIDVNKIVATYKEYNTGMITFINKILDTNRDVDGIIEDKINRAIKRDKEFIDDLFDETESEYTINEAMMNIEYLIDLNKDINSYISSIDSFNCFLNCCPSTLSSSKSLYKKLYAKSTGKFVHKLLKSIFKCFDNIKESVKVRESVVKKPEVDEDKMDIF